MNDLISRKAAIAESYDVMVDGEIFSVVQVETLYGLPSAQPEITMCKDCEHWYTEEDDQYGYCRNHDFWTSDIWFCADGDRRKT